MKRNTFVWSIIFVIIFILIFLIVSQYSKEGEALSQEEIRGIIAGSVESRCNAHNVALESYEGSAMNCFGCYSQHLEAWEIDSISSEGVNYKVNVKLPLTAGGYNNKPSTETISYTLSESGEILDTQYEFTLCSN